MNINGPDVEKFLKGGNKPDYVGEQEEYPWNNPRVRKDVRKQVNFRPIEPTKIKLDWLSENRKIKSLNSFIEELVEIGVERKLRQLGVYDVQEGTQK